MSGSARPAITVDYYTFWVATGEYDKKTKAEFDAQYLLNGKDNLWIKKSGDNIYDSVQYSQSKGFTPVEVIQNEAYFEGTSAAMRELDGTLITDPDGYVIFNA